MMTFKGLCRYKNTLQRFVGNGASKKLIIRFIINHFQTKMALRKRKIEQVNLWQAPDERFHLTHITLYAVSNAGDNVLSESIRYLFEYRFGKIDWNLVDMFSPVDQGVIHRLNQSEGIIIGGHGAFLPDTNPNDKSGWEWACDKDLYREINSPILLFAVGYNYFIGQKRSKLFENNINELLRRTSFFGLRNNGSVREIQKFVDDDIKGKPKFQPCATMIARYYLPCLPPKKTTNRIAFNVALDRSNYRMAEHEDEILTQIAKSMKILAEKGYEINFITHCDWEIRFTQYIEKENVPYKYHHATLWDTIKIYEFYNEMDMVIGMRGHGIWIPFGVNTHILALGNQNKTKWFLEDIEALDWNIDILDNPQTLSKQIIDKFVDIHEVNGELTTERLKKAQAKLWSITTHNLDEIAMSLSY